MLPVLEIVRLILSWRHSGFNVSCGPRIQPDDEEAMENLARYVVRASFSPERMTYLPDESQVLYRSKDGKNEKTFDALEWLAAMPACACRTQTGAPMFPIRANKWFVSMATTAMSVGVNAKRQTRTDCSLASCSPMNPPRGTARTGQGLSRKSTKWTPYTLFSFQMQTNCWIV